jgi:hypothetical protein
MGQLDSTCRAPPHIAWAEQVELQQRALRLCRHHRPQRAVRHRRQAAAVHEGLIPCSHLFRLTLGGLRAAIHVVDPKP